MCLEGVDNILSSLLRDGEDSVQEYTEAVETLTGDAGIMARPRPGDPRDRDLLFH